MSDSKEITRLRKAGQIQEALALARRLFRESPDDYFVPKAYGWALRDAAKVALKSDLSEVKKLADEFQRLEIPVENDIDEFLVREMELYSSSTDPAFHVIQEAKAKSKSKEYGDALSLYRQAVKLSPLSKDACNGLAWELWRCLITMSDDASSEQLLAVLREYARLKAVEKPSAIHSRILEFTTRNADRIPTYIAFVKWWDLKNLTYEDSCKQHSVKNDAVFDSLAERVIKALHKAGKSHDKDDDFLWISQFIGAHYRRFPDQEWFPYYYCKVLLKTGALEAARAILLPFVRSKQSESWAWNTLSSAYSDKEKKRACLCKALLCKVKQKQCDFAVEFEILKKSALFCNEEAIADGHAYCRKHAAFAESILTEDLPWIDAVVTGSLEETGDKKPLTFIGLKNGQAIDEVTVNPSKYSLLRSIQIGGPLQVKADSTNDRRIIVAVQPRQGENWDVFTSFAGVVSHVNDDKGIAHVTTSKKDFCLLYFDKFPEASSLAVGTFVGIKMRKDTKRDINHAVAFRTIEELPPNCSFYKHCSGRIDINQGNSFGFVDDCYVAPSIINSQHIGDGDHVSGAAVCEYNKRKGQFKWALITVGKVEKRQYVSIDSAVRGVNAKW